MDCGDSMKRKSHTQSSDTGHLIAIMKVRCDSYS